jgi:hypothetical protein
MGHLAPRQDIDNRIYVIRGQRVILDRDLASIFGVSTSRLNQQVDRNRARFPDDFAFRLTKNELRDWISQFATSNSTIKMGLRKPPYAFTEHGAVAAAFILNTPVAVEASVRIVRAFNRLRHAALAHRDLALALTDLARKVEGHEEQFKMVFDALRRLMPPPTKPTRQIGFKP